EATIAERVDAIAFPGLTANFDAANTAALAVTLADWLSHGERYAADMVDAASRLADRLLDAGVPVFTTPDGPTRSHAFAIDAGDEGGDQASRRLARANLLVSGIGLPTDPARGVRIGTNEIVRWGITGVHLDELSRLVADAWHSSDPADSAAAVSVFRRRFDRIGYCD
ncbi:MAG: hypothetical protein RLZZ01_720, partial [Actinomycetota bacterium]